MKRNVIVGQSGGPTSAINSSLAGVYRTAIARGAKKVYGMVHGIQGLLNEEILNPYSFMVSNVSFSARRYEPPLNWEAQHSPTSLIVVS